MCRWVSALSTKCTNMGRKLVVSGTKSVELRAENALGVPFRKWFAIHQPGLAWALKWYFCTRTFPAAIPRHSELKLTGSSEVTSENQSATKCIYALRKSSALSS